MSTSDANQLNVTVTPHVTNVVVKTAVSRPVTVPHPTDVSVASPGPQGPTGPRGPAGGEVYVFTQTASVNHWVINHNLGRKPTVVITKIDGVDGRWDADVSDLDNNTCYIDFLQPHTGEAELE